MFAMILAAGRGKRMLPLTQNTPKPLIRVKQKALIDYQVENLSRAGIRDFVVNCGRFGDQIVDHIMDNCEPDHNFYFSQEGENILETGGGIVKALPFIKSDKFIVVNADVFTNYNFLGFENKLKKSMHLVLVENPEHNPKGDFGMDNHSIINNLEPKLTFSGIGIYTKKAFLKYQEEPFPLVNVINDHIVNNQVTGEVFTGIWSDIGTPSRLKKIEKLMDFNLK